MHSLINYSVRLKKFKHQHISLTLIGKGYMFYFLGLTAVLTTLAVALISSISLR